MLLRVFSFLIVLLFCTSCDYFVFQKERTGIPIDSVIDFSAVDISPSFKICDAFSDKKENRNCFRKTMHQKIGAALSKHTIKVKNAIDETILVKIQIDSKGIIRFIKTESSLNIQKEIPQLDSILQQSIANLPAIYNAYKRDLPVTTEYSLPIRIKLVD